MSNNANDVVIVGHARTPFDKFGGVCRSIPSAKLAEWTIRELLKRTGLEAEVIDDVNLECAFCWRPVRNRYTRQALLRAGLRAETLPTTSIAPVVHQQRSATVVEELVLGEAEVSIVWGGKHILYFVFTSQSPLEGSRLGNMKLTDLLYDLGIPGFEYWC